MTATNHALTGAVIALSVKSPWLAVPASFVSHFLQDLVPHFDFFSGPANRDLFKRKFNISLAIDMVLAMSLFVLAAVWFPGEKLLVWACMFTAMSPDLAQAYYHLYKSHIKRQKPHIDPLSRLHYGLQWSATPWGLAVELAWAAAGLLIISSLR